MPYLSGFTAHQGTFMAHVTTVITDARDYEAEWERAEALAEIYRAKTDPSSKLVVFPVFPRNLPSLPPLWR
jgi:hypothetical protein